MPLLCPYDVRGAIPNRNTVITKSCCESVSYYTVRRRVREKDLFRRHYYCPPDFRVWSRSAIFLARKVGDLLAESLRCWIFWRTHGRSERSSEFSYSRTGRKLFLNFSLKSASSISILTHCELNECLLRIATMTSALLRGDRACFSPEDSGRILTWGTVPIFLEFNSLTSASAIALSLAVWEI